MNLATVGKQNKSQAKVGRESLTQKGQGKKEREGPSGRLRGKQGGMLYNRDM